MGWHRALYWIRFSQNNKTILIIYFSYKLYAFIIWKIYSKYFILKVSSQIHQFSKDETSCKDEILFPNAWNTHPKSNTWPFPTYNKNSKKKEKQEIKKLMVKYCLSDCVLYVWQFFVAVYLYRLFIVLSPQATHKLQLLLKVFIKDKKLAF